MRPIPGIVLRLFALLLLIMTAWLAQASTLDSQHRLFAEEALNLPSGETPGPPGGPTTPATVANVVRIQGAILPPDKLGAQANRVLERLALSVRLRQNARQGFSPEFLARYTGRIDDPGAITAWRDGLDELARRRVVKHDPALDHYILTAEGDRYIDAHRASWSAPVERLHFADDLAGEDQSRILQFFNERDWPSLARSSLTDQTKAAVNRLEPEKRFHSLNEFQEWLYQQAPQDREHSTHRLVKLWTKAIVSAYRKGQLHLPAAERRVAIWNFFRKAALEETGRQRLTGLFRKIYKKGQRHLDLLGFQALIIPIVRDEFPGPAVDAAAASAAFHRIYLGGVPERTLLSLIDYIDNQLERRKPRAPTKKAGKTRRAA